MLSTDREEFLKRLRVLFAGLDKPLGEAKEDAFWKGLANMSLIEFGRCCDLVLEELADRDRLLEYRKMFTPGDIWAAKQRLRVRAAAKATQPESKQVGTGDAWDIRANHLLLGYIGDQARCNVYYRGDQIKPLVAYKHAWAADMREAAEQGQCPSVDDQRRSFLDCMRRADAQVEQMRMEAAA